MMENELNIKHWRYGMWEVNKEIRHIANFMSNISSLSSIFSGVSNEYFKRDNVSHIDKFGMHMFNPNELSNIVMW